MTYKATTTGPLFEPRRRAFTDPLGRHLPALERCAIRHRSLQMVLILFHAEELKRDVLAGVDAQRHWRRSVGTEPNAEAEEPLKGDKKLRRAFAYLVEDGILSADEREHMVGLIGRRNAIAHHLDDVTADLSTDRWIRDWIDYMPERKAHDYRAVDQLRAARRLLSDRMAAKHYVLTISHRGMMFDATERVLDADLKALNRRIRKLLAARRAEIEKLNGQLSLEGGALTGDFHPAWPDLRYDGGRLTPRGIEVCYRLFDMGRSPMAVAHLMDLSLASARRRAGSWRAAGGQDRVRPELSSIPKVRIRRRLGD